MLGLGTLKFSNYVLFETDNSQANLRLILKIVPDFYVAFALYHVFSQNVSNSHNCIWEKTP